MQSFKLMIGLTAAFICAAVAVFVWALGDLARLQSWIALLPVGFLGFGIYCAHQAFILWAQSSQNHKD